MTPYILTSCIEYLRELNAIFMNVMVLTEANELVEISQSEFSLIDRSISQLYLTRTHNKQDVFRLLKFEQDRRH